MKIVFFGSSGYVVPILEVLKKNFNLVLVVTTEKLASQGDPLQSWPVISYCRANKIPYLSVANFSDKEVRSQLSKVNSQFAVLAYFGLIIPKEILKIFPMGILNIHPSLLPKYRGPTPGQAAILNGDKKTGVTLILLDEELDHGPILAQVEEEILPTDTAATLYERLFKIGAKLLSQTINQYLKREIKTSPQNHSKTTFTKRLTRKDGYIDIKSPPPPEILDRMIQAYYPWPGVWCKFSPPAGESELRIKFLPEKKIQVEGRNPMNFKDFLNGYPEVKKQLSSSLLSFFSNT